MEMFGPAGQTLQDDDPAVEYVFTGQTGQTVAFGDISTPGGLAPYVSAWASGTSAVLTIIILSCRTIISDHHTQCRCCGC